jgi:hypothetical protein
LKWDEAASSHHARQRLATHSCRSFLGLDLIARPNQIQILESRLGSGFETPTAGVAPFPFGVDQRDTGDKVESSQRESDGVKSNPNPLKR